MDEFNYFADPQVGKLFDLVLQVAMELHVTTQRLRALEVLLARTGVVPTEELDGFQPTDAEATFLSSQGTQYLARLMRVLSEAGPAEQPLREEWQAAVRATG